MRIMGVDPGTLVTGFGVIDCEGGKMTLVEYGVIRTSQAMSMPLRLRDIHLRLLEVIERTAPDEFAIESAFYSKNVQSTLKLGHARGVAILAAALREIPTAEYAPREVKQAVTGNGGATKEQVEFMVMRLLGITERQAALDATDAVAIAICHANRMARPQSRGRSWRQFVEENPDRVAGVRKHAGSGRAD
ncbi:MAG: crossover junction endodeoxyribonuclease RuvC [Bacteroidetes bacterium]|nr:crossover junction endodeoxyribonuclease RuvC [Bacteroidota bacterium]